MATSPPIARTIVSVAASSSATQSQSTLPAGVDSRNARWLIAKAGTGCRLISPGWCAAQALRLPAASAARVIHACPARGTYCRSSSQIGHRAGGASASG